MAEPTTISQVLPAPVLEGALTAFTKKIEPLMGQTIDTGAYAPTIAAQDALQTQAAQAAAGLGSLTGAQAYEPFMSPYQQEVIDTTLTEYDRNAAVQRQGLRDSAIQSGAYGGGREGVQRAEYQQASDRNRAALQSQLLQSGFGQAQQLAQRNFQNQMGLAQLSPSLVGQQISALGALGTQQQAQQQAQLSAQQQLLQQQANRPLDLAQQLGQGVTSLISGYPAQFTTGTQPTPSPLQTALGAGATLAGVYRAFN